MRIAVINHTNHTLFVEDVPEKLINEKYNGEEEAYIKDNYELVDSEWSWDYITDTQYITPDGDSVTVKFDELH